MDLLKALISSPLKEETFFISLTSSYTLEHRSICCLKLPALGRNVMIRLKARCLGQQDLGICKNLPAFGETILFMIESFLPGERRFYFQLRTSCPRGDRIIYDRKLPAPSRAWKGLTSKSVSRKKELFRKGYFKTTGQMCR